MGKADEIQSALKTYGDLIEALRSICADHPFLFEIFEDCEAFIALQPYTFPSCGGACDPRSSPS